MPRGRRPLTPEAIESQIEQVDQEIDTLKKKLASAKAKKKALQARKSKADYDALYQALKASGKSPEEFLKKLETK